WERRIDWIFHLDQAGWVHTPRTWVSQTVRDHALEVAKSQYRERLSRLRAGGLSGEALRGLLALCRDERIPAALVLMPEGPIFRSWYSGVAWSEFKASCGTWAVNGGYLLLTPVNGLGKRVIS